MVDPLILGIAGITFGPLFGAGLTLYVRRKDTNRAVITKLAEEIASKNSAELKKFQESIEAIALLVNELKTTDRNRTPYFDELQRSLASGAHRPSLEHQEKDRLLEELQALTLSPERRARLEQMLQAEIDDPEVPQALALKIISVEERLRIQREVNEARMLLATMPLVVADTEARARQAEKESRANMDAAAKRQDKPSN
jgi:hypothetical protein